MKSLNSIVSIFAIIILGSCGKSLPKDFEGLYIGSQPAHELMINGESYGMLPTCNHTFNVMSGKKIRMQESCEDDLPSNLEGSFEIITSTETSYTLDYTVYEAGSKIVSTGTIILNNDGTGKQITYNPQVELVKQ